MTIEIFGKDVGYITPEQLIDLHCVSYQAAVDLLISFMKFQISLDPDRYVEYISRLADQHDFQVAQTETHPLCQPR